jgi:hypothetical protein
MVIYPKGVIHLYMDDSRFLRQRQASLTVVYSREGRMCTILLMTPNERKAMNGQDIVTRRETRYQVIHSTQSK